MFECRYVSPARRNGSGVREGERERERERAREKRRISEDGRWKTYHFVGCLVDAYELTVIALQASNTQKHENTIHGKAESMGERERVRYDFVRKTEAGRER